MSTKFCPHCGEAVGEGYRFCPKCGGAMPADTTVKEGSWTTYSPKVQPSAGDTQPIPVQAEAPQPLPEPETIEQLAAWYQAKNLPPEEVTRFFIGKDIREARAFGIFRHDNGNVEVYKNKADGSRAVRYNGPDEKYAVTEFLTRLRQEIGSQKQANTEKRAAYTRTTNRLTTLRNWLIILVVALILFYGFLRTPSTGYYSYDDDLYYYQNDHWYLYDDLLGWYICETYPDALEDSWRDYYYDDDYSYTYGGEDFAYSSYYDYDDNSGGGWDWGDDDDDWDSGDDWDWGGTDWDSDW